MPRRFLRKSLKFLHTMAAIGFCGSLAALLVLHLSLPEPSELERFATLRMAMGAISGWILLPSTGLVAISGLLSMGETPAYHSAGWVWAKLASGILVLEGTLVSVHAPTRNGASRAQAALLGDVPVTELGATLGGEWGAIWVIFGVGVANVVLGIWRPRFSPKTQTKKDEGVEATA